jgi:aminoglycoside phosphotransferase family enzyme
LDIRAKEAIGIKQQQKVISSLAKKDAYPHDVSKIRIEETHISWVILTGSYAYKIKKELKFGNILNFSTLTLRKKLCEREVMLNKPLCDDMYRGIVKVVRKKNGNIKIVNSEGEGRAVEYAVKMKEVPQKFRMDNLLARCKVSLETIDKLIEILIQFHLSTQTNANIQRFGYPKFMKKKVEENFETLRKLTTTIDPRFENRLISFIENNKKLFYFRIKEGKVRDIHGDLYLKNIFITQNMLYLYDRIEFNDSLRYADVAEDIAHLCMDFDHHKRTDLRKHFLSGYIAKSSDFDLNKLVYFLMCYKACIRAKVCLFRIKNETVSKKIIDHKRELKDLFELAESYLELF